MSVVDLETTGPVAIVWFDDPGSSANTINDAFGRELLGALARAEATASVKAIVLASRKRDFVLGANVQMLASIKTAGEAERKAKELAHALVTIKEGTKPVVAAVAGSALGGGFELALACHAIVLADDAKVGLPEVQLGLLPAANGLLRVAERAGLQVALDLGLTGRNVRAAKAKKMGLAEEVCPRSIVVAVAKERALALAEAGGKKRRARTKLGQEDLVRFALEKNPAGRAFLFKKARAETRKKTRGQYPATDRIIDVVERFAQRGAASAAELEAKSFGELLVSSTSKALRGIFDATQALKKESAGGDDALPHSVAMIGGGLMGGGIAYVTINAGIPVRLKDRDDAGVGRGLKVVRDLLDERVKKKQISREERDQVFARLTGSADYAGIGHADVIIEAVFEDLALKHEVLRDVEAIVRPDAIFASNTSSISIATIAAASKRPENVVGMHYFSPVPKMPLLEIVRAPKTSARTVARAVALGRKQGKTVIVVKDGVGFYTSRILAPYMNEAAYLLAEGVRVDALDDALVAWGFPVGPVQLLDEVGIDVAAHVGPIMQDAFGSRLTPPPVMEQLVKDDRKGRKNGRGFYRYGKGAGGKKLVDDSVYGVLGVKPDKVVPPEEMQMRCALSMVNEAARCLGEGILSSPRDGDVGAIFGLGFPPFRGGPFRYVDAVGAGEIVRRIETYQRRFGERFTPAPLLVDVAKKGARFYDD